MRIRAARSPLAAVLAAVLAAGLPCAAGAQPEAESMEAVLQSAEAAEAGGLNADGAEANDPVAGGADAIQQDAADQDAVEAETVEPNAGPPIQTLGDGDQRVSVVDHGGRWSMHAENMATNEILRLWHGIGGPELVTKTLIDRPYTISVHRLTAERILARLLDGHGYTLHYDGNGRLVRVRVYSMEQSYLFKTPRLVESLGRWREAESGPEPTGSQSN